MRRSGLATCAVLIITVIWGSTFFIIKDAVDRINPLDYLAIRFLIASSLSGLVLAPRLRALPRAGWKAGLLLGGLYGCAQIAQTYGLAHTSASVSGFLTGTYVVLTPVIAWLIVRAAMPTLTWVAIGLAVIGLATLTLTGSAHMGLGEYLTLLGAFLYACHIVVLERYAGGWDCLSLTVVQLLGVTIICLIGAVPGGVKLSGDPQVWKAILYTALIAGVATMFLQTWAQQHLSGTRTALLMTFEPVFASLFAVLLGGEEPTLRLILGGSIIVAATIIGARATPSLTDSPAISREPAVTGSTQTQATSNQPPLTN